MVVSAGRLESGNGILIASLVTIRYRFRAFVCASSQHDGISSLHLWVCTRTRLRPLMLFAASFVYRRWIIMETPEEQVSLVANAGWVLGQGIVWFGHQIGWKRFWRMLTDSPAVSCYQIASESRRHVFIALLLAANRDIAALRRNHHWGCLDFLCCLTYDLNKLIVCHAGLSTGE